MRVLTGQIMSFPEARRILNTGDQFLTLLHNFQVSSIDDARLQGLDAYADNPIFRPQHVAPINMCAAKVR